MPPASVEPPYFLIIAGPNGSGKSTVYRGADIEAFARSLWIVNPDLLTARIREIEGLKLADANLQAVQRVEAWLDASIDAHQSVGVETVLQHRNTGAWLKKPSASALKSASFTWCWTAQI